MGLGVLKNLFRPLLRIATVSRFPISSNPPAAGLRRAISPWISTFWPLLSPMNLHSLTDTGFPKRRPGTKPRRKRTSLKPQTAGPYAWVQYAPGEPILANRPNEGSVKGRNANKRRKQRLAFILSEAKKRNAQVAEANRKKKMKRTECKMAAVARERAWAERLAELQKLELEERKPRLDHHGELPGYVYWKRQMLQTALLLEV